MVRHPGVRALDDPSSGKDMKALGETRWFLDFVVPVVLFHANALPKIADDIQTHLQEILHPLLETRAIIATIRPDHLETRQVATQRGEQHFAPFSIIEFAGQHFHADQQTQGIYQQVPSPAQDFFSPRHSFVDLRERHWF